MTSRRRWGDSSGTSRTRSEPRTRASRFITPGWWTWLSSGTGSARVQKGASGENPGSSPVANRKRASGQGRPQEQAKEGNPAHQPSRPTKVFFLGHVKTKVWANYQAPGSLTWSIQQVRVYRGPKGEMEARSFRLEDLRDAMRGAYRAERWIRKQERRHRLFGWFLGF